MEELIPFSKDFCSSVSSIFGCFGSGLNKFFSLENSLDISSDKNNIYVEVDIPGFDKKDIKITIKNEFLVINAEKEIKKGKEKTYRKTVKSYYLGTEVEDNIKVSYKEGILSIILPKLKQIQKSKTILIE